MDKRKKVVCSIGAAAVIAAAGYLGWSYSLKDSVIWADYTVNGVQLKGMTRKEAEEAIGKQFAEDYQDARMTIHIAEESYPLEVYSFLEINAEKEIAEAYVPGHEKWYTRGYEKLVTLYKTEPVSKEVIPGIVGEEKLSQAILETGIQKVDTLKETEVEVTEDALLIKKGSRGVTADLEELEKNILEALEEKDFEAELDCPVHTSEPEEVDLDPYFKEIFQLKKRAEVDPENDYKIIPSRDGVSFNVPEAEKKLDEAEEGETVTIDFKIQKPSITTEEMEERLFRDELASYTTYGGGSSGRVANLTLACDFCDGVVLMPGETFSYNDTVGERTAARGFQNAIVYSSGKPVLGIGGGICQVSSTIFAAVLRTELEVVERRNHSLTVAYLPMGMDAMVSWGTQDFQFRNNTDYPVRLEAEYHDGQVDVKLIGTKLDDSRIEAKLENQGGMRVKTYRSYYDSDGTLVKEEEISTSTYRGTGH